MKKCMIYGNCQHTHLEHFLEKSIFSKYFKIIKVKDVYVRDKSFLDDDTLSSLDCFIYQHVSENFDSFFSTDAICKKLRADCIKISIPNFWLSTYFPQNIVHPVVRPNKKYSISPSGIFPYGDKNINDLLTIGTKKENIIKILSDYDFYNKNEIIRNMENTFSTLNEREKQFNIDIPSVPWLIENILDKYLAVTVNHPTREYFIWLANSILNYLGIDGSCDNVNLHPFAQNHIHVPIYPSVIKHLDIRFIAENHKYRFYNEALSFGEYVDRYISHSIGENIPGKDSINISKFKDINANRIKLIPSTITNKQINNLQFFFKEYQQHQENINTVIWGEKKFTYTENSCCREIPNLEIRFGGINNLVVIHEKAVFNKANIRLFENGYVHIGNSRINSLLITNTLHSGGGCSIGDECSIGENCSIMLLGDNYCSIGNNCLISDKINIMCSDGHTLIDQDNNIINQNDSIFIGDHVWLNHSVTVLRGAIISDNSFVDIGSVVRDTFLEKNLLLSGSPAKCIRSNINWKTINPEYFRI
ncbi:WcbI family polysaccharide biosynthesis putative acetyltransferase [Avibacterium sp. 21-599]|uniref:WcbI family polysaccharide biosynthesis putative acetyltransferase n=1 Tax=Avibacterium sp. 21-599 TaxID=2911528 RepID=UPI002245B8C7|nr:WcbI family polysaccharide biosynthesis putative acetyltransferase [Avibacterium sp. 21-599]MCW9717786.1 hypothetical protein [Avibacterium sp. 21-599]